jgi:hypothetical protein
MKSSEIVDGEKARGAKAVAWLVAGIVIEAAGFFAWVLR